MDTLEAAVASRESVESVAPVEPLAPPTAWSDEEIVQRVQAGDRPLFEVLIRRHNQRLYRAIRSVLRDERDVEDVMQQAYVSAYTHLHQFEERSQFSTWLTRIALNEAFAARRKMRVIADGPFATDGRLEASRSTTLASPHPDPECQAYTAQLQRVLERAVDTLPDTYRTVFVLRDIEGLSTSETGQALGLRDEAVKTRLHRARAMVRRAIAERIGAAAAAGAFPFPAPRCDRIVAAFYAVFDARS